MQPLSRDRAVSATLTALVVVLLAWALVIGLRVRMPGLEPDALKLFDTVPPAPPPHVEKAEPRRSSSRRPEGRAAPPALRARATQVVAPPPIVPQPIVSRVIAAPVANVGAQATQGTSDIAGPGTGAGGVGDGTGSGGDGDGDGGGGGYETPPRRVRDGIRSSDLPDSFVQIGRSETNGVRFAVETDGSVTNCRVTRRSRNAELDALTCPLFERRFRYRPSLDEAGRPVRSIVVMDYDWIAEDER